MEVAQKAMTEELRTCLHIELYHPNQMVQPLYSLLPLEHRLVHPAEDPLRLGRDGEACTFALNDRHVSRKQLALQAFRSAMSSELLFSVQNLSQRGYLAVNSTQLGYLQRAELPNKALLRFVGYELFVWQEPGDSRDSFEVKFDVARISPCREMGEGVPCRPSVMDTGILVSQNSFPIDCSQGPLEVDEAM